MGATRDIAGMEFVCDKLPGEEGLELFLRASAIIRSARGLFIAVATGADDASLIHEYFEFAREMDPKIIHPLIMELARLPKPADGSPYPNDLDLESIVALAFFAAAINFDALLRAGLDSFIRREAAQAVAVADAGLDKGDGAA